MALRDQPYLPLYVQDFLTDEKLSECSASSVGVYIKIMCLMHKSEHYGKLLLKQKHKQSTKQNENFALMVAKHLPYDMQTILLAINELLTEGVLISEGDFIIQKRMVKDSEISAKRAISGSKGGKKTTEFAKPFAKAKNKANSEYENEYENANEIEFKTVIENSSKNENENFLKVDFLEILDYEKNRKNISAATRTTPTELDELISDFKLKRQAEAEVNDGNLEYQSQQQLIKHCISAINLEKSKKEKENGKFTGNNQFAKSTEVKRAEVFTMATESFNRLANLSNKNSQTSDSV
jgi:hypothetical protein